MRLFDVGRLLFFVGGLFLCGVFFFGDWIVSLQFRSLQVAVVCWPVILMLLGLFLLVIAEGREDILG